MRVWNSLRNPLKTLGLAGALMVVAVGFVAQPVWSQTRSDEAEAQRLNAESKAQTKIGYPDVYDLYVGGGNAPIDFNALSLQISRLAALMRAYGQSLGNINPQSTLPDPLVGQATGVQSLYGPDGPTIESVRVFLNYRLMVAGNSRLKVGAISEDAHNVYAKIVTTDNSLVEEYVVDKQTGQWKPLR